MTSTKKKIITIAMPIMIIIVVSIIINIIIKIIMIIATWGQDNT